MRSAAVTFLLLLLLPACDRTTRAPAVTAGAMPPPSTVAGSALAAARLGRCTVCHAADGAVALALTPATKVPLDGAVGWRGGDTLVPFLHVHHGGDDAAALAAFLAASAPSTAFAMAAIAPGAITAGERQFAEFACTACHPGSGIAGLAQRTDYAHLVACLREPAARRPDLLHDFALDAGVAHTLAAYLLREQQRGDASPAPMGLVCECFELPIDSAALPDLDARSPVRTSTVERIDVAMRSRDDQFALRFHGQLLVPTAGRWTFTCGSDDCSWLWIDDQLLVTNAALAPHRRRSATVDLTAGAHALRVVYTEAAGEQSLEVLWHGPNQPEQAIPATALSTTSVELVPPAMPAPGDAAVAARGRVAYGLRGCNRCHDCAGAPDVQMPIARWEQVAAGKGGACAGSDDAAAIARAAVAALDLAARPDVELAAALAQHRCLACHRRDSRGGLAAAAASALVEVEDLGQEGRVPPDLTRVGHRLRAEWLERTLRGEVRARPYVHARMPRIPPQLAATFVRLFGALDLEPGDDNEPTFSASAVEQGRQLAGSTGKNCITCHTFAGRRALGPQGMDLAIQHDRLRPRWFREWLLQPTTLRPGTRMPALWWRGDAADRSEVDALRVFAALATAAPVPPGCPSDRGLVLDPIERPVLHGAFLRGLSARCLCVGSPLRGHYAYDLEHARLAWLWRGAFLDARGTWEGRAGQLLRPLGDAAVVLDPLEYFDLDAGAGMRVLERRVQGQRRTADGYPVIVLQIGDAVCEDEARPRLAAGGVEIARTLRCVRGAVHVELAKTSGAAHLFVDDAPAAPVDLRAGAAVTIVYRW